jgi:uncharacterized protein YceH (UPF0502 family)
MDSAARDIETAGDAASQPFSLLEGRVLGVLIEKQRTVPDTYPLSLNALVAGCNQKTSRDPVIEASESEVLTALDGLKARAFIIESSGGRVARFAHNAERVWQLPSQAIAILAVLLLRGPQTAGELRLNCERLHRFADISAVEAFLHELAARASGRMVVELPRQPGTRETRWAQTLTGLPAAEATPSPELPARESAQAGLAARVAALEAEVAAMKEVQSRLLAALDAMRA